MKKLLLTTIQLPLGIESDTCTANIQAEMYHAQVTLAQDAFSLRAYCSGWGLEFMAANLLAPVTVMHYPTEKRFISEIKKNYDYVGISFVMCTFPKAIRLCQLVRRHAPGTKIILGGYGTVLKECDQYADYVCREEGVNYLKRLLGETPVDHFKVPRIVRNLSIMHITSRYEAILPVGLGCSRGCDFCCTSHFFNREYIPLLKTGEELHNAMMTIDTGNKYIRNFGIVDEDFLAPKERSLEMARLNGAITDKPILFSCLTSLKSLSQYSIRQLHSMGLFGAWAGVESLRAPYPKLKDINTKGMFDDLQQAGITLLASMIVGFDWHDDETLEEDFEYLMSLNPSLSQFMIYSPCPRTPLFSKFESENRLLEIPYIHRDGFHTLFRHPHFPPEKLEKICRNLFEREYAELGPSIFRIQKVQLMGYQYLADTDDPLLMARRKEHKRLCLDIYPLLETGIKKAPSLKVRKLLKWQKEEIEDNFRISNYIKFKSFAARGLYHYARLLDWLSPAPYAKSEIHYYNQ